MAYSNYYNGYPAVYPYQQYGGYQSSTNPQAPVQSCGLVNVRSAQEAFNYPVAPGASVTMKDETAPYIYVKTRGFSQLEEPVFEQFQLVKVDNSQKAAEPEQAANPEYALKSDLTVLQEEIDLLKKKVSEFRLTVNESEAKA